MDKPRCDQHRDRETVPPTCPICARIGVEQDIITRTVDALLSAGFALNVNNGGHHDELKQATKERAVILKTMMDTDDEFLTVYSDTGARMIKAGWVRFVYGNDGWDVINDYTTNLEAVMQPVNDYADTLMP